MIDLDKYAGHTPGPWNTRRITGIPGAVVGGVLRQYANGTARDQLAMVCAVQDDNGGDVAMFANAYLIAAAPELLAEVKRLRQDLHDTIRESQQYRAERDEALSALKDITPAMPSPLAHCHYGLLLQAECAHCNRIAAARAVLAKHGGGK